MERINNNPILSPMQSYVLAYVETYTKASSFILTEIRNKKDQSSDDETSNISH